MSVPSRGSATADLAPIAAATSVDANCLALTRSRDCHSSVRRQRNSAMTTFELPRASVKTLSAIRLATVSSREVLSGRGMSLSPRNVSTRFAPVSPSGTGKTLIWSSCDCELLNRSVPARVTRSERVPLRYRILNSHSSLLAKELGRN